MQQLENSLTLDRSTRGGSQACRPVSASRDSNSFPARYGNSAQLQQFYSTNQLQRDNLLATMSYDRLNAPMLANGHETKSNSPTAWVSRSWSHQKKPAYSFNNTSNTPRGNRAVKYTFSQSTGCQTSKLNASAADLLAESVQNVPLAGGSETLSKHNMQRVLALRALAVLKGASTLPPLEVDSNWERTKSTVHNGGRGSYNLSRHHSYTQNRGETANLGRTPSWMTRNYSFTRSSSPSQQIQLPKRQFPAMPINDVNNLSLFKPPRGGGAGGSYQRYGSGCPGFAQDICKLNASHMANEFNQNMHGIGRAFKVSGLNQPQQPHHHVSLSAAGAFGGETQGQVSMNSQKQQQSKYASDFDWVLPPLTLPDPAYPGRETYVSSDDTDDSGIGTPIAGISGIWNQRSSRKMSEWSDNTEVENCHTTLTKLKRLWHDLDSKAGADDFETNVFEQADERKSSNEKENWGLSMDQDDNTLSLTTVPESSLTEERDGRNSVMPRGEHFPVDALRKPNSSLGTTATGGSMYSSGETRDGDEAHHRESLSWTNCEKTRSSLPAVMPSTDMRSRSVIIADEMNKQVPNLTADLTTALEGTEDRRLFRSERSERPNIEVLQEGEMEEEARDGVIFYRGERGYDEGQNTSIQDDNEELDLGLDEKSRPPGLVFEGNFLGSNQQDSVVGEECFYTPNGADSRYGSREDAEEESPEFVAGPCESEQFFLKNEPLVEMYDNSDEFHEVLSSISNLVCRQLDDSSTAASSRTPVAFEI